MSSLDDVLVQFKGKTPDEIAAMMKRRSIKGRMGTTYKCPMALLLDGVSTGAYVIGRKYIVRRSGKAIEKARTPENIAVFVRRFDIGKYPDLVSPPPRCLAQKRTSRHGGTSGRSGKRSPIKNHLAKLVGRFHEQ